MIFFTDDVARKVMFSQACVILFTRRGVYPNMLLGEGGGGYLPGDGCLAVSVLGSFCPGEELCRPGKVCPPVGLTTFPPPQPDTYPPVHKDRGVYFIFYTSTITNHLLPTRPYLANICWIHISLINKIWYIGISLYKSYFSTLHHSLVNNFRRDHIWLCCIYTSIYFMFLIEKKTCDGDLTYYQQD